MLEHFYRKPASECKCGVFRAKGYAPDFRLQSENGQDIGLHDLPAFLRTLLVTDGTVTKSLEAYYWESVAVTGVAQEVIKAAAPITWLDAGVDCCILTRYVQLTGNSSGRIFSYAFSIIKLSLIPEDLRTQLLDGSLGIGELIRSCALETYREVLEIALTYNFPLYAHYKGHDQQCAFSTYRITLGGKPVLLVSEYVPLGLYARILGS